MKKILTVVVPAYNAEPYLETNLKSLCNAKWLADIEVLIINDGSIDKTSEIAEGYAKLYPDTFRVISKKNGGHGSGINSGIANATGTYFKVVDADDWVDQKGFSNLVTYLKTVDTDLVYSGFLWVFDHGEGNIELYKRKAEMKVPFQGVIYKKEYMFDEIAKLIYIKMHNITIKTEILCKMNLQIDEHCFYVDSEYISYPIPFVETICFLQDYVYMYRIGTPGQSISIEKLKQNEQHYTKVINSLLSFYSRLGVEIPCSMPKKNYLARIIARVVAGKYKVMLSSPAIKVVKKQMISFECQIKAEYPDIYYANVNPAIKVLRISHYSCYSLIAILVKRKYK